MYVGRSSKSGYAPNVNLKGTHRIIHGIGSRFVQPGAEGPPEPLRFERRGDSARDRAHRCSRVISIEAKTSDRVCSICVPILEVLEHSETGE